MDARAGQRGAFRMRPKWLIGPHHPDPPRLAAKVARNAGPSRVVQAVGWAITKEVLPEQTNAGVERRIEIRQLGAERGKDTACFLSNE